MPHALRILKSSGATSAEFHQAFHCAVSSIESVLFDNEFNVTASLPEVHITPTAEAAYSISSAELARLVEVAFVDGDGLLYPEFAGVRNGP